MGELVERSLLDLVSFIVDNRGRSCPTADDGLPLIATNCLKEGRREPVFDDIRYVDEHTVSNWFRSHPEPGDILFVCKGSPGRVALVPDPVPFCIAQDMVALRTDPDVVDSNYLYYRLRAPDVRRAIEGMHVGTMIPHFKKGDFGRLLLSVNPDIREQRAIAAVLGALDDKIAANERITRIADELSQALWTQAASAGEVVPLSRLAAFVNGRAFTKGASGTGRVVVRIAELNSGIGPSTVYNDIDVADEHLVSPGDILFAWSGSLTVARWYRHEAIVNQHIFKVIPSEGYPQWLVNQALRSKLDEFKAIASDKATTMGHIQRRHLDEPVKIPPPERVSDLNDVMGALWAVALAAEIENVELAKTRDEVLPLLMGGRIPIRTAVDDFKDAV